MATVTARLTHEKIRQKTQQHPHDSKHRVCKCGGHLTLFDKDGYSCKGGKDTPECKHADVTKWLYGLCDDALADPEKQPEPAAPSGQGMKLVDYAMAKFLPVNWLIDFFVVRDGKHPYYTGLENAVEFPYIDENGAHITSQWRWGMDKGQRRYLANKPTYLYGGRFLQMLESNTRDIIFLVEGESNTHTMNFNGYPTLGLPGVKNWKPEWANLKCFKEARTIFFFLDMKEGQPEDVAVAGAMKVAQCFPPGKVRAVKLPIKDVSALWLYQNQSETDFAIGFPDGADGFRKEIERALFDAKPVIPEVEVVSTDRPLPSVDMPETVLCGRLGDLLTKNLAKLPRSYAWLSLVAVAGVVVPTGDESTSLYVANVGPSGSGKDTTVKFCLKMLGLEPDESEQSLVFTTLAGSFEGFAKHYGNRMGAPGLWFSPELIHTLGKSKIEGASYIPALCQLYDSSKTSVVMARKERVDLSIRLSIVGGLVDGNFADAFGGQTGFGLYQRFLFGLQQNTQLDYEPYTGELITKPELQSVTVAASAREALNSLKVSNPDIEKRMLQSILRMAVICAAWDGRSVLTGDDMAPHLALADYQTKVRLVLRPDPGRNQMAQACNRITSYLQRHGGDVLVTKLNKDTNVSKEFGPGMHRQAIAQLAAAGEIEIVSSSPLVIRSVTVKL